MNNVEKAVKKFVNILRVSCWIFWVKFFFAIFSVEKKGFCGKERRIFTMISTWFFSLTREFYTFST